MLVLFLFYITKDVTWTIGYAQILDKNRLIAKITLLNQVLNTKDNLYKTKSLISSTASLETVFNLDLNSINKAHLISDLLVINANKNNLSWIKKSKINKIYIVKQANILKKSLSIFTLLKVKILCPSLI